MAKKSASKPAKKPKGKPAQKPAKPLKPKDNEPKFPKKPLPGKQVVEAPAGPLAFAGSRPMTDDEVELARFIVGRLDQARAFVAQRFGSADATAEYLNARRRYDEFLGPVEEYLEATADDAAALAPWAVQSYAEFVANACYQPRSAERTTWSMLRAAEVDVIRLAETLCVGPDGIAELAPSFQLGCRRFVVAYLDKALNDYEARLTVEDISHTLN